jgi:hypothetical protein
VFEWRRLPIGAQDGIQITGDKIASGTNSARFAEKFR